MSEAPEIKNGDQEPSPILLMYTYIMHFICLCVYILVFRTLWSRKSRDAAAQTYYLLTTHTFLIIMETLLVYGELSTVLPHLALKIGGVFAYWGFKPIIIVELTLFSIQTLAISIVMCLIFRLYLIKCRRFGRRFIAEKNIHLSQAFFYLVNAPFYFLFYHAEVPKEEISEDIVDYEILKDQSVAYFDSTVNQFFRIAFAYWFITATLLIWIGFYCIYRIFFGLSKNHQHSEMTKELHKRAVYSSIFMAIPIYATGSFVAFLYSSVWVLNLFGWGLSFDGINTLFTPLTLGNSLLVSANTLYNAYRNHILRLFGYTTNFEHRRMTASGIEFSMDRFS